MHPISVAHMNCNPRNHFLVCFQIRLSHQGSSWEILEGTGEQQPICSSRVLANLLDHLRDTGSSGGACDGSFQYL